MRQYALYAKNKITGWSGYVNSEGELSNWGDGGMIFNEEYFDEEYLKIIFLENIQEEEKEEWLFESQEL